MARLKKCKSCGNMIAKDAKICPQCGGRVKKSHGCLLFIILIALIFIGTCVAVPNVKSTHDVKENPNSPENADAFQVDYFSNDGAIIFVQNFLENNVAKNVKYTTAANIEHVSESVAEPFKKIGVNEKNAWSVSQEFSEKNAFGTEIKHKYTAFIEFKSGSGYRAIILIIDDVVVYPK